MKKKSSKFLAVALSAVMVASLAACGGSDSSSGAAAETTTAAAAQEAEASDDAGESEETFSGTTFGLTPMDERTTLSIGFFAGSAHSMPWYVADKMGFFDELNIDVEYQSFTGGPAMMEANADWDICDVGGPGMLNGMKNYDIVMLGACDNEFNTALFVREGSDLAESPADPKTWRGKRVLLNKGTTLQYMFMQYMNSIGIDDTDAYGIDIIDSAVGTCLTAFETGEGDALCAWNAFAVNAENDGYIRITDIGKMGLNNICSIGATPDALQNKTELIKLAYQVYYLTWEWAQANPANLEQAQELFMDSCDDEGVAVDMNTVVRLLEEFQCPTLADAISDMTTMEPDRNGSQDMVSVASNQLFETLDFLISLGSYEESDREHIIEDGLVDPVIAEAVQ